jgi:hypothetical protein
MQIPKWDTKKHEFFPSQRSTRSAVETTTGIATTGVIGLLRGTSPEDTAAAGAMDCLPVQEEMTDYRSRVPGQMLPAATMVIWPLMTVAQKPVSAGPIDGNLACISAGQRRQWRRTDDAEGVRRR